MVCTPADRRPYNPPLGATATPAASLATRNSDVPSACRVFGLTLTSTADTSQQVRVHLLRPWTLHVCLFDDEETAKLWATGVVDGTSSQESACGSSSVSSILFAPPTPPGDAPPENSFLCAFFCVIESVVDLSDPQSASSFFIALGSSKSPCGVTVQGLGASENAPRAVAATPAPPGKRRRPSQIAGLHEAPLTASRTGGAVLPCEQIQERWRVAWDYQGGTRAGSGTVGG